MSDDEKPDVPGAVFPNTPSHAAQMQDEGRRLEQSLQQIGDSLGLRLSVRYDPVQWCFRIYAKVKGNTETHDIDEMQLVRQPAGSTAFADLVTQIVTGVQLRLHDKLAVLMTSKNWRGRQFLLSTDDKSVLHDMFMDASLQRSQYYGGGQDRLEADKNKVDEYQALMDRLFR